MLPEVSRPGWGLGNLLNLASVYRGWPVFKRRLRAEIRLCG